MTNYECTSYAILAMEKAGLSVEVIGKVLVEFPELFDRVSEESAVELASHSRRFAERYVSRVYT